MDEIIVIPFHGQGHVFPCVELCRQLASRGVAIAIVAHPSISRSLQSVAKEANAIGLNIRIMELGEEVKAQPTCPFVSDALEEPIQRMLHNLIIVEKQLPLCVIADVMLGWLPGVCDAFHLPRFTFFTSSACSVAFEYALWKHRPLHLQHNQTFAVPGFPASMPLTPSDAQHRPPPPPPHRGELHRDFPPFGHGGPPPPPPPHRGELHRDSPPFGHGRPPPPPPSDGDSPPWMNGLKECRGLIVNTCKELESPFIEYTMKELEKPLWAVGPLMPSSTWEGGSGGIAHDSSVRKKESSIDEERCVEWLNSKGSGSVLYVCFGSEVGPSPQEIRELAYGLEAVESPFIWVLQTHVPHHHQPRHGSEGQEPEHEDLVPVGFESRTEGRGLVIRGWAPQLLILSHPSTGGFVSHCGWNSSVESICHGVPLLAWPIRGDQHYNAKLLVQDLKIAAMIDKTEDGGMVGRNDVVKGVRLLMESEQGQALRGRALALKLQFSSGFPSSQTMLDDFAHHILHLPLPLPLPNQNL